MAKRLSIEDAFTLAAGMIEQQPGRAEVANKIIYRSAGFAENESDYEAVPYRLYVNQNHPEVLDWAVPPELSPGTPPGDLNTVQYLRDPDQFVGRQEDLEALSMRLRRHHRVSVEGIGGIGKTTLLRAFCYRYGGDYDHKVWINGQDDLLAAFLGDHSLHNSLQLPVFGSKQTGLSELTAAGEQKFSAADYFKLLMQALRKLPGRNLLVIDNAHLQILDEDIRRELPEPVLPGAARDGWDILVSTRENLGQGQLPVFADYPLHTLSPAAARALFLCYHPLRAPDTEAGLAALLQFIDYHPLTVEIFAKSLAAARGRRNIQTLMDQLQAFQLDDTALPFEIRTEHAKEAKPFKHLLATFDPAGLGDDEKALLKQLVFLPATPIDLKTLEHLVPGGDAQIATLNRLSEKGWINLYLENQRDKFKIHRMVAEMLTYALQPQWEEVEGLVEKVWEILDIDQTKDNPVDKFEWVSYGAALTRYFAASNAPAIARLNNNLAIVYQELGKYGKAAELLETALASDLKNFGPDHPTVAVRQSNLAIVYWFLGRYECAAELLETALASDLKNFGPEHPNVAVRQSNLANVYGSLGRYERAAELLETALHSDLKNFGPEHPNVAIYQSKLGDVYRNLGHYGRAVELLESALASDLENFGSHHPTVAVRQSYLANVCLSLGSYERAVELLEISLASTEKNFGPEHPNVAVCQSNLATVIRDLGQYERAAELFQTALASNLKNFGPEHPNVAVIQSGLASVYRDLGQYERATELFQTALASNLKNFGPKHPNVAAIQSGLASVYAYLGQYERAAELFQTALASDLKNFGPEHSKVAEEQSNLANVYGDLGRYERAAELLETALASDLKNFGPEHPNIAIRQWKLSQIYVNMGKISEGQALAQAAYLNLLKNFGPEHPHTKIVHSWLSQIE